MNDDWKALALSLRERVDGHTETLITGIFYAWLVGFVMGILFCYYGR